MTDIRQRLTSIERILKEVKKFRLSISSLFVQLLIDSQIIFFKNELTNDISFTVANKTDDRKANRDHH